MTNASKTVTKTQLDALRNQLAGLPKKAQTEFSARETVKALAAEIHRMVNEDGYSFADVADLLRQSGVALNPSTIRSYLQDSEAKKAETQPNTRKTKPMSRAGTPTVPKPLEVLQHSSDALSPNNESGDAEVIRMVVPAQINHG